MNSLERLFVQLEQDLKRRTDPGHLKFTPESALVTSSAVKDTRDVPKVVFELIAKLLDARRENATGD